MGCQVAVNIAPSLYVARDARRKLRRMNRLISRVSMAACLTSIVACAIGTSQTTRANAERSWFMSSDTAELFAPFPVSANDIFRGTFSPDMNAFYYFKKTGAPRSEDYRIFRVRWERGAWTAPDTVRLGESPSDLYPALSPDGNRLVFTSYRRVPGDTSSHPNAHLWYSDRVGNEWGAPLFMAKANSVGSYHPQPIFGPEGALYFMRISPDGRRKAQLYTRWNGREYDPPDTVRAFTRWEHWRSDQYVWEGALTPDGRAIILSVSALDSARRRAPADLWASRLQKDGSWSEPRPLGAGVNSAAMEHFVFFSPDGREMFFVRDFRSFHHVSLAAALP